MSSRFGIITPLSELPFIFSEQSILVPQFLSTNQLIVKQKIFINKFKLIPSSISGLRFFSGRKYLCHLRPFEEDASYNNQNIHILDGGF